MEESVFHARVSDQNQGASACSRARRGGAAEHAVPVCCVHRREKCDVACALGQGADTQELCGICQIFTIERDPFSKKVSGGDAVGFSHRFVEEVFKAAASSSEPLQYKFEKPTWMEKPNDNNNGIFNAMRVSKDDPTPTKACDPKNEDGTYSCVVCMGVASISITSEREASLNFLPSYFQAGMKVMVPSSLDTLVIVRTVGKQLLTVGSQVVAFFVFFTLLLAPMVWVFEMIEMSSVHGLPIFISRTEIDSEKRRLGLIWAEQVCVCVCVCVCVRVCVSNMYVRVCVCVHMHPSAHMQTRPHTHAHEPTQTGDTPAVQQEKEVFMSEGRQSFIEFQSLLNTFKWTAYIISGATVYTYIYLYVDI